MDNYTISITTGIDTLIRLFVRSLRPSALRFACHGNTGTEIIYNGCWTNAAAEASYDRAVFSSVVLLRLQST